MTQRVVNYTYGTGNPVLPDGSIDVRDGIDNLQSFDIFMNADEDTYNQRDGGIVQTVSGAIRSVGFKPGSGDFTTGFTVMPGERDIVWYDPVSQNWYSYIGVIPTGGLNVVPGTNPIGDVNWAPRTDELLRSELGKIVTTVNTVSDIPSTLAVGARVNTLGRYAIGKGPGEYVIMAGTSPYPLVDPQVMSGRYAKLLPLRGTNYNYSVLAAGGKNDLTVDGATSTALNQLMAKIYAESPVIGGLAVAEGGQYYLSEKVSRPAVGAKHLGIIGEYSNLSYGTYESRTIFYFDNNLIGDFAFDFFDTQFMTFSDFALRGDVGETPTKGGLRIGKAGSFAPGYGNHLLERVQATYCTDGFLLKNAGISTVRDMQLAHNIGRGLALETSGDSNLWNVYANDNNKNTTNINLSTGVGVYVGQGSNNTNVFGGKLEFNSKGLVVNGSNGVNMVGIQYDYNKMANLIAVSLDDAANACRGLHSVGCRYLSGGVITGYQFASIYLDTTFGSASLSITGGGVQAAGDGAFDTSNSGTIGPQVGIYGNGNGTYSLDVTGCGMTLINPGVTFAAVASGSGTKIKLSGSGGKKNVSELAGGKVYVGFDSEIVTSVLLSGISGTPTYSVNSCDCTVMDGIAEMDIHVAVTSAGSISGPVSLIGLPFTNTSGQQASAVFSMISSVNNTPTGMFGYVLPGDNKITLWKRQADGSPALLQGSDITNSSLLRMSIRMKVS